MVGTNFAPLPWQMPVSLLIFGGGHRTSKSQLTLSNSISCTKRRKFAFALRLARRIIEHKADGCSLRGAASGAPGYTTIYAGCSATAREFHQLYESICHCHRQRHRQLTPRGRASYVSPPRFCIAALGRFDVPLDRAVADVGVVVVAVFVHCAGLQRVVIRVKPHRAGSSSALTRCAHSHRPRCGPCRPA
jgi:hypothetical protein